MSLPAGMALALFCAYWSYVHQRKGFRRTYARQCAALGTVPFLRYLVLANHSFLHAFFTYRAQLATLLAAALILAERTGRGSQSHG